MIKLVDQDLIKKIRDLRKKGHTYTEIARKLKIAKSTAWKESHDIIIDELEFLEKKYNIDKIGQIRLRTLATLIEKEIIRVDLNPSLDSEFEAINVTEKGSKIIVKGIKKITEL